MDRSSAVSEKQPPSPPSSTSRAKVGKSRAETPPASLQIIWNSSAHSDAVPSKPVKTAKRHISFSPTPPPEPPLGTSASKTVRTSSAREGSAGAEEDAAAPPLPPSPAAGQAAAAGEATAGEAGATAGGPDAAATSAAAAAAARLHSPRKIQGATQAGMRSETWAWEPPPPAGASRPPGHPRASSVVPRPCSTSRSPPCR
mmetsp:Transcript_118868/g.380840  ORF Transcript_118868/g.380840 Transcript_118868/m.380840 type:complete len:200 (+) Transcript_118868:124-723(+)